MLSSFVKSLDFGSLSTDLSGKLPQVGTGFAHIRGWTGPLWEARSRNYVTKAST